MCLKLLLTGLPSSQQQLQCFCFFQFYYTIEAQFHLLSALMSLTQFYIKNYQYGDMKLCVWLGVYFPFYSLRTIHITNNAFMTDTWISALTPLNMTRASNNTKGKRRKRSKQKVSANDFGVGGLQKIFCLPSSKVFILYRISF